MIVVKHIGQDNNNGVTKILNNVRFFFFIIKFNFKLIVLGANVEDIRDTWGAIQSNV